MSHDELKVQFLQDHIGNLDKLCKMLDGLAPSKLTVASIELTVRDTAGDVQDVRFNGDELDAYILFSSLKDMAAERKNQLQDSLDKLIV